MKKALKIAGVVLIVLIAAIIALPFMFKGKIIQMAKDEANNNLNAKVDWKDFDLTLLSSFPNFTFVLNDFKIIGVNDFKNDTLIALPQLELGMDIMSVIKGEKININKIVLKQPRINAIVLKDGRANWDITKPSTDTATAQPSEPSKFKVGLKKLVIEQGNIVYDDKQGDMYTLLKNLNHELKGDFTQDIFDIVTTTSIDELTYAYGGVSYLRKVKTGAKVDMTMDMPNFKFTFKENEFSLNALVFGLDGFIAMPKEDVDMDIKFNAKKASFKEFLSLVPGTYTKDFESVKTSGKLAFDGYAKGTFNEKRMPAFGIKLLVENAMFQYPSLPKAVKDINIDLKVDNKDGEPDHTLVDLRRFHMDMGGNPVDMKMYVTTPVSDANIDGMVKGKINLASVKDFVPMEGTEMNGVFTADVTMKGRYSSIEKEKYDEFKASGNMLIENFNYKSKDLAYATSISKAAMSFTPEYMDLSAFDAVIGKSDVHLSGKVDNYMGYVFKDELLHGKFNFQSNKLDLNEFMAEDPNAPQTPAAADTAPMSVVEVPANLDVELNSDIKQVIYDKLDITNVKGLLTIKESRVTMSDVMMNLLSGKLGLSGYYDTKNVKRPDVDFQMAIDHFDIPKTYAYFNSVQKMAPAAKYAKGAFSSNLTFQAKLDSKMEPDYNSINSAGKLQTHNVVVENLPSVSKIADQLKMPQYKRFPLENVDIAYKLKDGKVEVDPFDVKIKESKVTIAGVNYLDQKIDYKMIFDIPRSEMGSAANTAVNGLVAQAAGQGVNVNLGERIKVNALVTGTVKDPQIKLDLKDQAKNLMNDLKDQAMDKAKAEADKLKAEAEAKARAEAEKLKAEAEAKVKAEVDKVKAEAEAKKKELEAKAKAEAEKKEKELKEKAKKEAADKLKGVFGGKK